MAHDRHATRHAGFIHQSFYDWLRPDYKAESVTDHGVAVVRLTDASRDVVVSIVPSIGNRGYEMKVHGKNILYFPYADAGEFQTVRSLPEFPFLAPWADLLNEPAFWANGRRYRSIWGLGMSAATCHPRPIGHSPLGGLRKWRRMRVRRVLPAGSSSGSIRI